MKERPPSPVGIASIVVAAALAAAPGRTGARTSLARSGLALVLRRLLPSVNRLSPTLAFRQASREQ